MVDFHACKWPPPLVNGEDSLAQTIDSLNEPGLSNLDSILEMDEDDTGFRPPLITFSHFLPLQVVTKFLEYIPHLSSIKAAAVLPLLFSL